MNKESELKLIKVQEIYIKKSERNSVIGAKFDYSTKICVALDDGKKTSYTRVEEKERETRI